ncbi:glycine-rich RNA-binding protein 4, mitochondrial-like protein [Tanacetum coccineum]
MFKPSLEGQDEMAKQVGFVFGTGSSEGQDEMAKQQGFVFGTGSSSERQDEMAKQQGFVFDTRSSPEGQDEMVKQQRGDEVHGMRVKPEVFGTHDDLWIAILYDVATLLFTEGWLDVNILTWFAMSLKTNLMTKHSDKCEFLAPSIDSRGRRARESVQNYLRKVKRLENDKIYLPPYHSRIMHHKESGRSRGFGFVNFSKEDEATSAKDAMDGKVISGQKGVVIKDSPISNVGSHVQFHSVETANVVGGDVQNFTSTTSMVEGSDINNVATTSIVAESSSEMHVDDFSQWMTLEVGST